MAKCVTSDFAHNSLKKLAAAMNRDFEKTIIEERMAQHARIQAAVQRATDNAQIEFEERLQMGVSLAQRDVEKRVASMEAHLSDLKAKVAAEEELREKGGSCCCRCSAESGCGDEGKRCCPNAVRRVRKICQIVRAPMRGSRGNVLKACCCA